MHHVCVVLLSIMFAVWPATGPPVPDRWRSWPVTRVFPAAVPGISPSGARVTYLLTGVAPEAPCRSAFHPGALPARPASSPRCARRTPTARPRSWPRSASPC